MPSYSAICPHCRQQFIYHPGQSGQVVRCVACSQPVQLPALVPQGQPPAGPEEFAFEPSPERFLEGTEPWYYGFLDRYTRFVMWLGIICVVGVFLISLFAAMMALDKFDGGGRIGGITLITIIVVYLPCLAVAICAILFQAALVLLAVDAARNLRKLLAQARRSR